jgi:hypothetical protein
MRRYGILGYCHADKTRISAISNTIDNLILCPGCRYFKTSRARVKPDGEKAS